MKKITHSLAAMLLCLVFTLILIQCTVFAASGTGTKDDPYIITNYNDLYTTMLEAPTDETCYIKLGADISDDVNDGKYLHLGDSSQNVVLDLAGYDITYDGSVRWCAIALEYGTLTIKDSVGGGTLAVSGGNEMSTIAPAIIVEDTGKLIIEGGNFKSDVSTCIGCYGGTTIIKKGNFMAPMYALYKSFGACEIYGGTFQNTGYTSDGKAIKLFVDEGALKIVSCNTYGDIYAFTSSGANTNLWYYLTANAVVTIDDVVQSASETNQFSGVNIVITGSIPIFKVDITGVVEPVAGETPVKSCDNGYGYIVYNVGWWDNAAKSWLTTDDTFVAGNIYEAIVYMEPEIGFSFGATSYMTGTINGQKATVSGVASGEDKRAVSLSFTCPEPPNIIIDKVDISVTAPQTGEYQSAPVSNNTNAVVNAYQWYYIDSVDGAVKLAQDTAFVSDRTYQVRILLYPNEGYAFDDNTDITINGKTAYIISRSNEKITCSIDFVIPDENFIVGDVNMDGQISANDSANILTKALNSSYVLGCEEAYSSCYMEIADVTGDNSITSADAAAILQKTLDSSFVFPRLAA